jgi:glyoxylase-like metal-dependent hydrolase (beta-lactamase superfamily II)
MSGPTSLGDGARGPAENPAADELGGHEHGTGGHLHGHPGGTGVREVADPVRIAPGIVQIDTLLGGWSRMTAGYLVEGTAPVLVETGSQSSVPVLLAALDQLGLGPRDLAGVAVTHIHLDHAGGVGDVARAFPDATVYVHEKGARHLADPSRLVSSAARVYGDLLDTLYGRLDPTPPERLHVLADTEEVRVGPDRVLTAVDSPGHAKHHLGLHDSVSGILFAGDAVGVRLPDAGVLRPATPPPDFDLDQALHSLDKFAARHPCGIALAHYGLLGDPQVLLAEAEETLRQWAEVATQAWHEGRDIAEALAARFSVDTSEVPAEHRDKLEILNGFHSNADGFRRWLETRNGAGTDPVSGAVDR